jgi:flagellar motor switch protein FliG
MSARNEFSVELGCDPLRQCALVLHSIRLEDRKWLLANLKGALVAELEQLLGELQALGIPADPAMAQTVLTSASQAPNATEQAGSPVSFDRSVLSRDLQRSRSKDLGEVLRDEPVGLIARVLKQRERAEQRSVLARLHALTRRQVKERMASTSGPTLTLAPRSLQALEEQVSMRLARPRELPLAPGGAGFIGATLRILRLTRARP